MISTTTKRAVQLHYSLEVHQNCPPKPAKVIVHQEIQYLRVLLVLLLLSIWGDISRFRVQSPQLELIGYLQVIILYPCFTIYAK